MHDIAFPVRKTDDARRADQELVAVLEQTISTDEPITVRAVVRRMTTLSQPSSITRDVWRMGRITAAEQERIRKLTESSSILDVETNTQILADRFGPDIRYLFSFMQIARVGNFAHAARELNVGQPTLSRQIQALEKTFGAKLLLRHSRGATLTRAGLRLARRLETALPLITTPLHDGRREEPRTESLSSSRTDTLSFGVIPGIAGTIMQRIIPQFRALWPNVTLSIHEEASAQLEERIIDQELDIALLEDPSSLDALYTQPISTDRFGLIASVSTSAGNDHSPIRLHDLVDLPLVLPSGKDNIRRRLEKACFQHGLRLSLLLESDSLQVTQAMVRSGLAFTVLPSMVVQDEIVRGSLIFRDIVQPAMTTLYAVAANREAALPGASELMALVRDAMISLVAACDQLRVRLID
jgi:LysR family nitrogen assimilation transcriptional regulator